MASPDLREQVTPSSYEEVGALLRELSSAGIRVRISGGGTKLGWGRAEQAECRLSTRSLTDVIEHNAADLTAVVQAGVRVSDLQRVLRAKGQRLALDPYTGPDDQATIGGVISTADSGPLRHQYGSPRDLILGVKVALPDGTLARSGGKVIKNVAGYDLGKLYAGSFGTLGLILEAAVRLHPIPEMTITVVGESDDAHRIGEAVGWLSRVPLEPEALDVRWNGGRGSVLVRFAGHAADALAERASDLITRADLRTEIPEDPELEWQAQREDQRALDGVIVRVSGTAAQLPELLKVAEAEGAAVVGRGALGVSWLSLESRPDPELSEVVERLRRDLAPSPCIVLDAPDSFRRHFDVWGLSGLPERRLMTAVKDRFDPGRTCNPGMYDESM